MAKKIYISGSSLIVQDTITSVYDIDEPLKDVYFDNTELNNGYILITQKDGARNIDASISNKIALADAQNSLGVVFTASSFRTFMSNDALLSSQLTTNYNLEVAKGNVSGSTYVHKFGANELVDTALKPVTTTTTYPTPQVAGATTLRIKAGGNANDTLAGSGAREVTFVGLDETGALLIEAVTTLGVLASAVTTGTFIRLFTAQVTSSGSYATSVAGSHSAAITIENGAGGTDWAIIPLNNSFATSRSRIAVYTVPLGKTAYLLRYDATIETTKIVDLVFFKRENILETAAPYTPMEMVFEAEGLTEEKHVIFPAPFRFPELTDIGFMAAVSVGNAEVTIDFTILLVDN